MINAMQECMKERNYKGEQALCCEMMMSSYVCQPNHSNADGCMDAGVLHSIWSESPHQGNTLQYYS